MLRLNLTKQQLVQKVKELEKIYNKRRFIDDEVEWQDVVDNEDNPIGLLPRKVIWEESLQGYTRVVNIFINDSDGYILVPIRSEKKSYLPGGYDFSCGENLKSGEDYDAGAIRGLHEELSLDVGGLGKGVKLSPDHKNFIFCFMKIYSVTIVDRNLVAKFNTEEVDRLEWLKPGQIQNLIKENPTNFKEDYKSIFSRHYHPLTR